MTDHQNIRGGGELSFLNSVLQSELLRNTTVLISGTALAQLIPILLQPLLRRFYSPDDFGAFAVYLSLVGIFIVITSFKYELAVILPHEDKDAANLLIVSFSINFVFNITIFVAIAFWHNRILRFLNLSEVYSLYLYLVPAGTFLYSAYQSINYWLIRKKSFFQISLNKFVRRGAEGGMQLSAVLYSKYAGLILGDVIGQISNVALGMVQSIKGGLSFKPVSWKEMKRVAGQYSEFPKFNMVPGFMSACSFLLPALIVNKYFTSEYAGYLDLSRMLLSIPLALVATSLSSVMLQRASEKFRSNESIKQIMIFILLVTGAIAIVEVLVILLFGTELFKIIFGNEWEYSGIISEILVWSYAVNFIAASFSFIFISLKKIKLLSIWQLFYFISILILLLFREYDFLQFVKAYMLIEIICSVASLALIMLIVIRYEEKISVKTN